MAPSALYGANFTVDAKRTLGAAAKYLIGERQSVFRARLSRFVYPLKLQNYEFHYGAICTNISITMHRLRR